MKKLLFQSSIMKTASVILILTAAALIVSGCSLINDPNSPLSSIIGKVKETPVIQEAAELVPDVQPIPASETEEDQEAILTETEPEETVEPTPEIHTIQLWVPPQFDTQQDTLGGKALQEAIELFTESHPNTNITLRVKAVSGDSSMLNTITSANHIAKDVLPSLALFSRSDMETAVQRGLLVPITTSIFSDSNSWYSYARQAATIDNTIYGIPILGDSLILAYRPAKTGSELTDWQDILTRGLPIGFAPSSTSLFGTFIYLSLGGKLTNDQGQPSLDQQKLIETLNFFLLGGQNGAFPPSLAQLVDQAQVWQRFNDGTMSIIVSQYSSFRHYQTPQITALPLPSSENKDNYPLVNVWNLVLIEDNPALQADAVSFAEFLSDTLINDSLSATAGYLPVRVSEHEAWAEDPLFPNIQKISENAVLIPNNQIINKVVPIINTALSQVIRNQSSPEAAATDAIAALN